MFRWEGTPAWGALLLAVWVAFKESVSNVEPLKYVWGAIQTVLNLPPIVGSALLIVLGFAWMYVIVRRAEMRLGSVPAQSLPSDHNRATLLPVADLLAPLSTAPSKPIALATTTPSEAKAKDAFEHLSMDKRILEFVAYYSNFPGKPMGYLLPIRNGRPHRLQIVGYKLTVRDNAGTFRQSVSWLSGQGATSNAPKGMEDGYPPSLPTWPIAPSPRPLGSRPEPVKAIDLPPDSLSCVVIPVDIHEIAEKQGHKPRWLASGHLVVRGGDIEWTWPLEEPDVAYQMSDEDWRKARPPNSPPAPLTEAEATDVLDHIEFCTPASILPIPITGGLVCLQVQGQMVMGYPLNVRNGRPVQAGIIGYDINIVGVNGSFREHITWNAPEGCTNSTFPPTLPSPTVGVELLEQIVLPGDRTTLLRIPVNFSDQLIVEQASPSWSASGRVTVRCSQIERSLGFGKDTTESYHFTGEEWFRLRNSYAETPPHGTD